MKFYTKPTSCIVIAHLLCGAAFRVILLQTAWQLRINKAVESDSPPPLDERVNPDADAESCNRTVFCLFQIYLHYLTNLFRFCIHRGLTLQRNLSQIDKTRFYKTIKFHCGRTIHKLYRLPVSAFLLPQK